MNNEISDEKLILIVNNLRKLDSELEHVEFKHSLPDENQIAKTISGITNSMSLTDCPRGYFIWGIHDSTHDVIGTEFRPYRTKVGNEELPFWLSKHITPTPNVVFREIPIEGKRVIVLIIEPSPTELSKFNHEPFIRMGANTTSLRNFPNLERELWSRIANKSFETIAAKSCLTQEEVFEILDFDAFYRMRQGRVPVEEDILFEEAVSSHVLCDNQDGTYDITNLGAVLYARDLHDFPHLSSKSVRIIKYTGQSKLGDIQEERSVGGYIVEFQRLFQHVLDKVISREAIGEDGVRRPEYLYPQLAIRELFANMLAHQNLPDITLHPMVEIYSDRIEFTNPGKPLVPVLRMIDYPPQTRNRYIVDELIKTGICESLGTGWDKIADQTSNYGFPAPKPDITENTTRIIMHQKRTLADMTNEDRIWTVYIFACLLRTQGKYLTNALVRQLFNIPDENASTASAILAQAVDEGLICIFDEKAGNRNRKYIPNYNTTE